jgi:hypothetical protein
MQDLGHAGAQLGALVARYPWQAFAVVMAVVLVVMILVGDRPRRTSADFDFGLFGGDGDGGDGGDGGGGD